MLPKHYQHILQTDYHQNYIEADGAAYEAEFSDHLLAVFIEPEIRFSKHFALRPGFRSEYSTLIQKWNLAPRLALALKTGKNAQLSGAWGLYHQTPQSDYLKLNTDLDFEKSAHYILSFQAGKVSTRLFRTEAYHKTYKDLITFHAGENGIAENLENNGDGYATGFDIFWRDQKSIKGFDYWITYSYIDTKRKYKYYPEAAAPEFISDHTLSLVGKYWLNKISTQIGASYTLASGRPYDEPETPQFNDQKTASYSDLSINFSHIFYIGSKYSVLYFSINNVLGEDDVLSYRPTGFTDGVGNYELVPVKRDIKRMMFIGLFLNF